MNHRIRDAEDYTYHHTYIWENPVRAGSAGLILQSVGSHAHTKALSLYGSILAGLKTRFPDFKRLRKMLG